MDLTIFDKSELKIFENKFNIFKKIHPTHINDYNGPFVYGCANDWIIVFEKLYDTNTNENREGIVYSEYAEYKADKLKVVLIFNKFDPRITTDTHMYVPEIYSLINYEIGKIISTNGLSLYYYKSVIVPYFMNSICSNYNGFYVGWYDTGFVSEKGYYVNGERNGIWKFGSILKKTHELKENDFISIEYQNGIFKKYIENENTSLILNNANVVDLNSTLSYSNVFNDTIFQAINYTMQTIDYYFPNYLPSNWKSLNK